VSKRCCSHNPAGVDADKKPPDEAEIVIVGGGMVGSSLAAGLATNPALKNNRIVLLEGAPSKPFQPLPPGKFSNRVSALNPATSKFLSQIGAWQHIQGMERCHGFSRMFVWDECSPANIEFNASEQTSDDDGDQDEHLGFMVENDITVEALTRVIKDLPDLQVVYGAKIDSCKVQDGQDPTVTLQNGHEIKAGLLVGADGANSIVRRSMSGHYFAKDYEQMGVVGTLTFDQEFDNDTAYQKFMKTGPIAVLPLSSTQSSLVWTVPRSWAKNMTKELTSDDFVAKLNQALEKVSSNPIVDGANVLLGSVIRSIRHNRVVGPVKPPPIVKVENLAAFPLGIGMPERPVSRNKAVLVGDAFHRIHPLAGQGVNLGFGDAETLIKTLSEGVRMGRPLGDYETLCDYETQRLRHNLPMMAAIDSLQKLYCTDNSLFVLARSLGLQIVNSNPTFKNLALHQASN